MGTPSSFVFRFWSSFLPSLTLTFFFFFLIIIKFFKFITNLFTWWLISHTIYLNNTHLYNKTLRENSFQSFKRKTFSFFCTNLISSMILKVHLAKKPKYGLIFNFLSDWGFANGGIGVIINNLINNYLITQINLL